VGGASACRMCGVDEGGGGRAGTDECASAECVTARVTAPKGAAHSASYVSQPWGRTCSWV
jgi:hypothetical protein